MAEAVKDEKLEHLSNSSIRLFQRCAFAWYCRYVQGLKIPPSAALSFGKSFHSALELNYKQKQESHKDLSADDMKDCFCDSWEKSVPETEFKEGENQVGLKDTGAKLVGTFHKEICPKVQPVETEIYGEIEFDNSDFKFVGYPDLIDDKDYIIDNKTAGRSWNEGKALSQLQPVSYSLLKDKNSDKIRNFRFDIGIKLKTPKTQQFELTITQEQRNQFLDFLARIKNIIEFCLKTGNFLPAHSDDYFCSRRWCGYYQKCENCWHRKIRE